MVLAGVRCRLGQGSANDNWGRVSKFRRIPVATNSARKRIFAIVSRPNPAVIEGKTTWHVLIFDNYQDTLQLILQASLDVTADDFAIRRNKFISFISDFV